jgi:hypothetical protein
MHKSRFSQTEVDTVSRPKPKRLEPRSADGVGLSECLHFRRSDGMRECADYNRSSGFLWSQGIRTPHLVTVSARAKID